MSGEEVRQILFLKNIKLTTLAEKMGESQQNLSAMLKVKDIKTGALERISEASGIPLLEFFGETCSTAVNSGHNTGNIAGRDINAPVYSVHSIDEIASSEPKGVPYYDIDFLGTFGLSKWDENHKPKCWVDMEPYNDATCWCTVTGHSMEPEINSGDIIVLKEIPDFSILSWGEMYAIVATNGVRFVKRVNPSMKDGHITLVPTNASYSSQDLPIKSIKNVYAVLACLKKL